MYILYAYVFLFALVCNGPSLIWSGETSRKQYLELVKQFPRLIAPVGDYTRGEIQIVLNPQEMAAIEKEAAREVGIVARDKYWVWINDACIFPSGAKGVYGRIVWNRALDATYPGVAVMPITKDGKIILNCNFRHATRTWEIELPRGCVNIGEEPEAAAKRETIEETGMLVNDLVLLGNMPPDTGLTNTVVPIYVAKVLSQQNAQPEDSEAIEDILYLTVVEVKQAFLRGYCEHKIRGVRQKIAFRDPFLAYALLVYELKEAAQLSGAQ